MHDNRSHPLLEQVPLTVNPFVKLPAATTLPYTYKPMPSTLPPSNAGIMSASATAATNDDGGGSNGNNSNTKPKYVVSQSGHMAHPDDIVASCRALQAHVAKLQADAERDLRTLDERIRARELAEKRRVAPGWLDSEARLLEPERRSSMAMVEDPHAMAGPGPSGVGGGGGGGGAGGVVSEMAAPDQGEELDRFFGGLRLGK